MEVRKEQLRRLLIKISTDQLGNRMGKRAKVGSDPRECIDESDTETQPKTIFSTPMKQYNLFQTVRYNR